MRAEGRTGWGGLLAAGLAGAAALTALHEGARQVRRDAPRMDIVAGRALRRGARATGTSAPRGRRLYATVLAGDLISNALYYAAALALARRAPWAGGGLAGLLAGIGGLVLPQRLGLGRPPRIGRTSTQVMTIAWYLVGGLVSAAARRALTPRPCRAGLLGFRRFVA